MGDRTDADTESLGLLLRHLPPDVWPEALEGILLGIGIALLLGDSVGGQVLDFCREAVKTCGPTGMLFRA